LLALDGGILEIETFDNWNSKRLISGELLRSPLRDSHSKNARRNIRSLASDFISPQAVRRQSANGWPFWLSPHPNW